MERRRREGGRCRPRAQRQCSRSEPFSFIRLRRSERRGQSETVADLKCGRFGCSSPKPPAVIRQRPLRPNSAFLDRTLRAARLQSTLATRQQCASGDCGSNAPIHQAWPSDRCQDLRRTFDVPPSSSVGAGDCVMLAGRRRQRPVTGARKPHADVDFPAVHRRVL